MITHTELENRAHHYALTYEFRCDDCDGPVSTHFAGNGGNPEMEQTEWQYHGLQNGIIRDDRE